MHRPLSSCTDLAERASTLLAEFRLSAFERALARNLSYGDQRKLEVALSLAGRPRLLLLDERWPVSRPLNATPCRRCSRTESVDRRSSHRARHRRGVWLRGDGHRAPSGKVLTGDTKTRSARIAACRKAIWECCRGRFEDVPAAGPRRGRRVPASLGVRRAAMLNVIELHTYYGDSHVLQA